MPLRNDLIHPEMRDWIMLRYVNLKRPRNPIMYKLQMPEAGESAGQFLKQRIEWHKLELVNNIFNAIRDGNRKVISEQ